LAISLGVGGVYSGHFLSFKGREQNALFEVWERKQSPGRKNLNCKVNKFEFY